MVARLKAKWGIESNLQFWLIMIAFSITGSSLGFIVRPTLEFLGFGKDTHWTIYVPMYILIAYPSYQIMLIFWGSLLGQFQFFWEFEKKMLRRFGFKNL